MPHHPNGRTAPNRAPRRYDLEERLIDFAVAVCQVAERVPATFGGRHIADQLVRSGTSVSSHYAEARAAESRRDFIHKMHLCLKELRESLGWLKLLKRLRLAPPERLSPTLQEANELTATFVRSIETATRNA